MDLRTEFPPFSSTCNNVPSNHCHQTSPKLGLYQFLQGVPFSQLDNLLICSYLYESLVEFLWNFQDVQFWQFWQLSNVCWCVDVMMLHNTTFCRGMLLCLLAAKWVLSSTAREMHTCTLAGYVITRQGCIGALLGLGLAISSFVHKKFQNVQFLQHKIWQSPQKWK